MSQTDSDPGSFFKGLIVYPFALAVFPMLSLFSRNIGQTWPEVLIAPALLVLAGTALLFFLLTRLLRKPELAALLTSLFFLYFFLYGLFTELITKVKFGEFIFLRNIHRIPLYTGLFLLLAYGLVKLAQRWRGLTRFLNVFSVCLLLVTLLTLAWQVASGAAHRSPLFTRTEAPESDARTNDVLPDIYYIILDGYGSADVLSKYFSYDNKPFVQYLKGKGFYLPAKPRSNYAMTMLSLGSSLSMNYLHNDRMKGLDNQVQNFLETNGYQYVSISSMYPPMKSQGKQRYALSALFYNEFSLRLLRTTVIDPLALRCHLYSEGIRRNILWALQTVREMPEVSGRKFVFAHIMCPHPPYVFRATCQNPGPLSEANLSVYKTPWDNKEGYVQQVIFLNTKVIELVETLLQKSKVPPIIVLQGDHGPKLTNLDPATTIDMHMHILNAYYLPGANGAGLYDTITPVNSFRVIFNHYFHAHFPILEDKSYFSSMETPFRLSDVTAQTSQ